MSMCLCRNCFGLFVGWEIPGMDMDSCEYISLKCEYHMQLCHLAVVSVSCFSNAIYNWNGRC